MLSLADKLIMDRDNTVTFFLDPQLNNDFMKNVANDLQCVTNKEIKTINTQVH